MTSVSKAGSIVRGSTMKLKGVSEVKKEKKELEQDVPTDQTILERTMAFMKLKFPAAIEKIKGMRD
jgi:hypothetical protein